MTTTATTTTTAPSATPGATDSTIITTIKRDWSWLVSHLIVLAFVALLVVGAVYGVDSIVAKHEAAQEGKYAQILKQQETQTTLLQQQLAQDAAQAEIRDAQYQATIAQLSKSIQVRDTSAKKQQQTDSTLNAVSAAARLAQQTNAQAGEITVANDNITLDLPITKDVVTKLDALTQVQADLQDEQNEFAAQVGLTNDANTKLADADKVIASQTLQLTDSTKACQAQVKALKAHYRKKLIKVGVISYVAGFVSGVVATLIK
jgi:hypothetical protein